MKGFIKDEPILQLIAESQGYDCIDEYLEATVGFMDVMEDQYGKTFEINTMEEGCYVEFRGGYCWPFEAVILMED